MALESLHTFATFGSRVVTATGACQFPHLDSSIQGTRNEVLSARREGDRVDRVLVAVGAFQTLNKVTSVNIPDANTLIKRPSCNKLGIWGDSYGCDSVLDGQRQSAVTSLNIPQANSSVTTARCDGSAVSCEVKRVDVLFVSGEVAADGS